MQINMTAGSRATDYEPEVQCSRCGRWRSIRWYQQSISTFVPIEHPVTGKTYHYGKPYPTCPNCWKGQWRGAAKGQPGKLFRRAD